MEDLQGVAQELRADAAAAVEAEKAAAASQAEALRVEWELEMMRMTRQVRSIDGSCGSGCNCLA